MRDIELVGNENNIHSVEMFGTMSLDEDVIIISFYYHLKKICLAWGPHVTITHDALNLTVPYLPA